MANRIIYVPGKNLKPDPKIHRHHLWRCLISGVDRAQPALAAELQSQPEAFRLAPWNHMFYGRDAVLDQEIPWIDRLLKSSGPTAAERKEAASWHKTAIKFMYAVGDRFHRLLQWIPDPRVKAMIADTAPYFGNQDNIANVVRNIVKRLICDAAGNEERVLLIGHSMGSVIAYEALWQLTHVDKQPCGVDLFLTIGSPLGMHYVQKRLLGFDQEQNTYPHGITSWENVSAVGDLISLDETMQDDFSQMVAQGAIQSIRDHCGVYNWYRNDDGLNVHRSYGYLVNPVVGEIIANWWRGALKKHAASLIAHRGYPEKYPENTLLGFEQAINAGARFIELDVQLTQDRVPVLYHDADTLRVSGHAGSLFELSLSELKQLDAGFADRFGNTYQGTPVATLAEFSEYMAQWPEVHVFVEVKPQSVERFGIESSIDQVMAAIGPITDRCTVISFHDGAIEYARVAYGARIGWVLPEWDKQTEARARELEPEFIFVYIERLPTQRCHMWNGPWEWAVYVVNDAEQVKAYQRDGIYYIETDRIGELLPDPRLSKQEKAEYSLGAN